MPIDAKQPYDDSNIFAKILRGEIPCKTVLETDTASPSTTSTRWRRSMCWSSPRAPMSAGTISPPRRSTRRSAALIRAVGEVARMTGADSPGLSDPVQRRQARRPGSAAPPCPRVRRPAAGADAGAIANGSLCKGIAHTVQAARFAAKRTDHLKGRSEWRLPLHGDLLGRIMLRKSVAQIQEETGPAS